MLLYGLGGFLNNSDWDLVRHDLQKLLRDRGSDSVPVATFSLWRLVKDALLTDKVKIKDQLAECEQALNQVQEEQMAESLKDEGPLEDSGSGGRKRLQISKPKKDPEDLSSLSEEEEGLEREIEELEHRLKRANVRVPRAPSIAAPPPYNPDWNEDAPTRRAGVHWGSRAAQVFPMIENADADGQPARAHVPLAFKDIKQLKEAVINYGPHAPFTLTLFESFSASQLIPNDWQQLCRAVLSGGDFLLWKSEYHERCRELAQINLNAGHQRRNAEMLTGTGQYATIGQQINYDPGVYAQIASAAVHAWKALPVSKTEAKISKISQGPSEPYSDFIAHLMQAAGKIFPNLEQAMPLIRQLAYENANTYCQNAIKSSRAKSIDDMIRACKDIDGPHITGQVLAAALKTGMQKSDNRGTRSKGCFKCGKEGHIRRNCPERSEGAGRGMPGICPRCHKGNHWSSECRSKFDIQGNPIPSGNGSRGPPRAPEAKVYGAVQGQNSAPGSGRLRRLPLTNPFLSGNSPGEHQEAQDWTSVPPPERY
ncbi:endogenous retrovirus group K member 6 Gag polyprotein-like [Marmota marmota marmota]|uniref:endogenous retrovirus group K member 6 Gag polyprotein-like n=1 Tax=Marmota marmota marmota TaxID=9994 RepID=UPI0007625F23|nr:endogenous retrovirus group K member 6 Gag polyprotein-like [Marmota marmota marmota]